MMYVLSSKGWGPSEAEENSPPSLVVELALSEPHDDSVALPATASSSTHSKEEKRNSKDIE